jgi:hypothetical protein
MLTNAIAMATTWAMALAMTLRVTKWAMARVIRVIVTNAVAAVAIVLASAVAAAAVDAAADTTIAQRCCPQRSHCSGCRHHIVGILPGTLPTYSIFWYSTRSTLPGLSSFWK